MQPFYLNKVIITVKTEFRNVPFANDSSLTSQCYSINQVCALKKEEGANELSWVNPSEVSDMCHHHHRHHTLVGCRFKGGSRRADVDLLKIIEKYKLERDNKILEMNTFTKV